MIIRKTLTGIKARENDLQDMAMFCHVKLHAVGYRSTRANCKANMHIFLSRTLVGFFSLHCTYIISFNL